MPDRSVKHVCVRAHATRDDLGNLEFVGAAADVTEQHESRAALESEVWLQHESPRTGETARRLGHLRADEEKELIESALAESRGRVAGPSGAAAKLGIPRSTLETKIRGLGIDKHQFKSK